MSIATAIQNAQQKVTNAYTAVNQKGGTLPATQNLSNLPAAINSISTGITPTGTLSITTNGVYDVTNYASADVSVSGEPPTGTLTIIDRSVVNGVYKALNQNYTFNYTFRLPSTATDLGQQSMENAFENCTGLISADFSSLTTVSGKMAMHNAFYNCTGLTSVDFSNLQVIGINNKNTNGAHFKSCFVDCPNLISITFPKLEEIYCTSSTSADGTFNNCNSLQKLYFPKLHTLTYGAGAISKAQSASKNIFRSCNALTELHFGAANQTAIEASPGYSTAWGRGAGNVTIYFDL